MPTRSVAASVLPLVHLEAPAAWSPGLEHPVIGIILALALTAGVTVLMALDFASTFAGGAVRVQRQGVVTTTGLTPQAAELLVRPHGTALKAH